MYFPLKFLHTTSHNINLCEKRQDDLMGNKTTLQTRVNGRPRFSVKNVRATPNALVNDNVLSKIILKMNDPEKTIGEHRFPSR